MAQSSSSSSSFSFSFSRYWQYDVFPSFRGEDVGKNFLPNFLKELDLKLITAFNHKEIKSRQVIVQAIRCSRIAVVVLSNNYASASSRLNDLLEIMYCKEHFGKMVIPIFYGLNPLDVIYQSGDFGKAFDETCSDKTEEVKIQWRRALTNVADIVGYHSGSWINDPLMIEEIANDIFRKLLLTPSKYIENFVGIEDHIAQMSMFLQLESEEVRMVGILGSSGIGKTTIARVLFGRLSRHFQSSTFIDRVFVSKSMDNYSRANPDDYNMKLHLQEIFLSEILGKKIKIDHLGAARERLKHDKVLIVIDDLDDQQVLEALAGQTPWFGPGSRIILVTNDIYLLRACKVDCIYEVCLPSEETALQNFCLLTFGQEYAPYYFRGLASEVALRAGSLPLGLTVLGSYLRGRNKEDLMEILPRLRNCLNGKIEKTLRVGYDGLNNKKDEALFRHIACLFNGEKVDDIKLLLADSDWDVNTGFENLVYKSLIHLRGDIVEMPHLLQQMGKEIVRTQSNEPGEREFLVDSKDTCEVLGDNTGTQKVLGISLDIDETDELHIHKSAFKWMHNLLFLKVYSEKWDQEKKVRLHLPKDFDYLPPKLRLLRLDGYPMKCLPSNFFPENLIILRMQGSKLEKLWQGVHPLKRLRIMDLRRSRNLKEIPDLSMAINLETLCLANCSSLVELPSSIQYLNNLKKLDMSFCENLESLPIGINLQSLYRLDLRGCSRLRSFPDISTSISVLNLSQTAVENIPSSLRLENLIDLYMEDMMSHKLWVGVQPLTPLMSMLSPSLMVLWLSDIQSLVDLPSSFQNLHKLKELSIRNCINLETLLSGINLKSLYNLNLSGCSRLKSFPDISTNISVLCLDETGIEEVPSWIENFSNLTCLTMNGCNLRYVSSNIHKLKHLGKFEFSNFRAVIEEASWNDTSSAVAMTTKNVKLPVLDEAFSSLLNDYYSIIKLNFTSCFNLGQDALLQQQSVFKKLILAGEEVPFYFTHRTTGTSLTLPLLQTSPSQAFFKFEACAVVDFKSLYVSFDIQVCCRFIDRLGNYFDLAHWPLHFSSTRLGCHLVIFDYCCPLNEDNAPQADLNYYLVHIQFHLMSDYAQLKLKGCGIRLPKDGLRHVFGGDKSNTVNLGGHETKHFEECGDSETDGILWDAKTDVNTKEIQCVQGGEMIYEKSTRGDNLLGEVNIDASSNSQNNIENKRVDPVKEEKRHGKVSESSTLVIYERHMPHHQVFINFWGEEVRFSFISHLVSALSREGVNIFTRKYEKMGEDLGNIFQNIKDSNIALVVFSIGYTESRSCLDELVMIKECMDERKLSIIPIFYKVEPLQVKQLEGDFGLKLWNLWRIHRDHRIIKWKDALETVAAMMGTCLKENSSESEFITSIVNKVKEGENPPFLPSTGREKTTKLSTVKGEKHESFLNKSSFFGLEQRMKHLEQKLEFDCNETRIIGVVGMAGIGKTTLATMLHEKWNCKFVRCVPLLSIREKLEDYRPAWLRKTFLEVLLEGEFQIINDQTTHESVKEKLLQTKVFVILDDVSNKEQLNFLLDDLKWIKKGSKIVITSRHKSLIEGFVHDTFVVPSLNYGEALQQFSYHAFADHVFHPTETSMKLCREFLDCAGGNPLVIKLLGKQLQGRDEAQWEIRQGDLTHFGTVILDIFRFSFDELSEKQKDAFLDIACFFRSKNYYFVRSLLDSTDHDATDAESEVRDLTHKGMIAISGCRVEMHDLLYMFGKIFSSQAWIEENGGKSRLWFSQEIIDALINQKDTKTMRGIFLDMSEVTKGVVLNRLTFINMINLRYLKIYDSSCARPSKSVCKLPDGLEFPLEKVRYLHWLEFPLEELPADFRPENLVDLRLPYSRIKRVWEGVKDTPRLKWVDLSHSSKLLNLSALAKAESLQRLNLEGCTDLDELPGDMQNMKSLIYLNLRGCIRLWSIPKMDLISLKTLILSNCSNLKEFQVISKSLEALHLDGTAIKGLPPSIENLQRLVLFNMKNCKMLECLPNCLGQLKVLEELVLSGCSRLKNLPDIRQSMKHVQTLLLDGTGVNEMPNISCFIGSEDQASVDMVLRPSGSYPREWPRGFGGVSSLRRLCLSGNDFVSLQNDIGQLYNLTWLDVKQCKKLSSVPMLPPRLQYFDAHGCDALEKVANPLALLELTEQAHAIFNFSNCNKLDQDAHDSIIAYTRRRSQLMLGALSRYNGGFALEALVGTCFPGWQVPEWFSHRGSGSVLEPKLHPHWCDNRFTGIALCAVILFPGYHEQRNRALVNCKGEYKNEDGSSVHFGCTVGGWNELNNTPQKMESSHVFIGYTSRLDILKHGGYDEEGCFCTKSSFEFQVTDGTEKVVGCEVLQCGFSLVYATDEREKMCCDAKTVVIPKIVNNVPGEESSYADSQRNDGMQYQPDATQNLRKSFESKRFNLLENAGGEITISSSHHNTPSENSNTKIHDGLRLCLDQLNERQKDVFLDIACFFRSEDEYFIRSLLDSGDADSTDALSEVRDLAEKLVITICDGRVELNDRLYMFAKDIDSPGRLRLRKYKDILDKLRKMKNLEANNVRGIFLDMSEITQSIAIGRMTFINMRNLRYLKIYESCCPQKGTSDCKLQFPDGFDFSLEEVRYFNWLKFPLEELPLDFRPENLVDLKLPYSKVERLWKGVKDTPRLKWVDLSHSRKLLNFSALAKAESLQRLNLEGCTNLDELPGDMQNMKSLVYLNMRGCIGLSSLPTMNLISLRTLILSNCSNLKEFQVISKSLEALHLDGTSITGLPLAIQKLQRLVLLNLKNCKSLECLPNCLGKLKVLEELVLSGCSRLKNLPDVRQSMKHVQILLFDGTEAKEMPKVSCFIGSKGQASVDMVLQPSGSYLREWPRGFDGASSLRRLCLSGNDFVSLQNDIGKLYNLTWLDVKQCKKLRSVTMLPPRLQYFDAHGCDSLERVANPLAIQMLTEQIHASFNFSNCNKLDQDATDSIISYTWSKSQLILDALSRYNGGFPLEASIVTCFPGCEVPAWFSHRSSGPLLEPKLPPHWCDSRFAGIALCAVIRFPGHQNQQNRVSVKCNCELKDEDRSRIRFSCTVGGWSETGDTIESSHVFIGYASKLDIRKLHEDKEEGCIHTKASFEFQVTDGTKELEGCEVLKCAFSLVYASDELQVSFGERGTTVEANQAITSSSWVHDFFGYIFMAFSCLIIFAILSFSVIVFAPQYYLSFSDFCWPLLFRIFFFVAFGLFLKQETITENQS